MDDQNRNQKVKQVFSTIRTWGLKRWLNVLCMGGPDFFDQPAEEANRHNRTEGVVTKLAALDSQGRVRFSVVLEGHDLIFVTVASIGGVLDEGTHSASVLLVAAVGDRLRIDYYPSVPEEARQVRRIKSVELVFSGAGDQVLFS